MTEQATKVYVLETGCYEQRMVHGVYATPEAAMAAWQRTPQPSPRRTSKPSGGPWSYAWSGPRGPAGGREWTFDADWDDAADVTEYEVEG